MSDVGVPAHAHVVVAAPHGDVLRGVGVLHGEGEGRRVAHHLLEHAVRVVLLLLLHLVREEPVVVEERLWGVCNTTTKTI